MTLEQYNVLLKYAAIVAWALVGAWTLYQVYLTRRAR